MENPICIAIAPIIPGCKGNYKSKTEPDEQQECMGNNVPWIGSGDSHSPLYAVERRLSGAGGMCVSRQVNEGDYCILRQHELKYCDTDGRWPLPSLSPATPPPIRFLGHR